MKTYILSLDPDGAISRWGYYNPEDLSSDETSREILERAIFDEVAPFYGGIFLVQQEKSMMGNLFHVTISNDGTREIQDGLPEGLKYELRYRHRTKLFDQDAA
jgi:hypothetical protein